VQQEVEAVAKRERREKTTARPHGCLRPTTRFASLFAALSCRSRCTLLYDYPSCNVRKINSKISPMLTVNVTDTNGCLLPNSPATLFSKYGDPEFENIPTTLNVIMNSPDSASFLSYVDKDFDISSNPSSPLLKSLVLYGTPFHNVTYYMKELGEAERRTAGAKQQHHIGHPHN